MARSTPRPLFIDIDAESSKSMREVLASPADHDRWPGWNSPHHGESLTLLLVQLGTVTALDVDEPLGTVLVKRAPVKDDLESAMRSGRHRFVSPQSRGYRTGKKDGPVSILGLLASCLSPRPRNPAQGIGAAMATPPASPQRVNFPMTRQPHESRFALAGIMEEGPPFTEDFGLEAIRPARSTERGRAAGKVRQSKAGHRRRRAFVQSANKRLPHGYDPSCGRKDVLPDRNGDEKPSGEAGRCASKSSTTVTGWRADASGRSRRGVQRRVHASDTANCITKARQTASRVSESQARTAVAARRAVSPPPHRSHAVSGSPQV